MVVVMRFIKTVTLIEHTNYIRPVEEFPQGPTPDSDYHSQLHTIGHMFRTNRKRIAIHYSK